MFCYQTIQNNLWCVSAEKFLGHKVVCAAVWQHIRSANTQPSAEVPLGSLITSINKLVAVAFDNSVQMMAHGQWRRTRRLSNRSGKKYHYEWASHEWKRHRKWSETEPENCQAASQPVRARQTTRRSNMGSSHRHPTLLPPSWTLRWRSALQIQASIMKPSRSAALVQFNAF